MHDDHEDTIEEHVAEIEALKEKLDA